MQRSVSSAQFSNAPDLTAMNALLSPAAELITIDPSQDDPPLTNATFGVFMPKFGISITAKAVSIDWPVDTISPMSETWGCRGREL